MKRRNLAIFIATSALRITGFWPPPYLTGKRIILYRCYTVFMFLFLLGTYLFIQLVDMCMIWGDVAAMTGNAFLLFTNLAQCGKLLTLMVHRSDILQIINDADKFMEKEHDSKAAKIIENYEKVALSGIINFFWLTTSTIIGWAIMPLLERPNKVLPLRAWYPYDTSQPIAYELTYAHQIFAIFIAGYLNNMKDSLFVSFFALAKCRLALVSHSLENLQDETCDLDNLEMIPDSHIYQRLIDCVNRHQEALSLSRKLEICFNKPILAQLLVSTVIICVTTFQLIMESSNNSIRLLSTITYLFNMTYQIFLYCWRVNDLTIESENVINAAYNSCWYRCSFKVRLVIILVMKRGSQKAKITAGGFVELSSQTFLRLIKVSYTFFTVLKRISE